MNLEEEKCVLLVNHDLPIGLIANTAAVLGVTLGKLLPEIVGPDVKDASDCTHLGIVAIPIPILKCDADGIETLREKLYDEAYSALTVVDFQDIAQSCKNYEDYIQKIGVAPEDTLKYFGLAICGPKKLVNKLTGSMPLLR